MNAFFDTIRSLGPVRLAAMAGVAAGILAFFIYLTSRLATPEMALLYGDLNSQDSGQIVAQLEQANIPYKIGPDGSQIYVPAGQVGRLRLTMAEQGLPNGGSMGYEIFDRSEGLGSTNFVQNLNHLRALEGELGRTIRSIADVKNARVHLVMPRRELFSRDRQEPSASIIVTMDGNRRLDRNQVAAVQHLVAAAVPGLKPRMISIVDNQGSLLARGGSEQDSEPGAGTGNAEEMRAAYERGVTRTIEELLSRSVGPGNVRAEVRADMDFDRITENAEIYDPDGQVVRSTQTVEETSDSLDGGEGAPVTVGNNLPDADLPGLEGGGAQSQSARTEETVNYEISRTVRTHVREAGNVRKLSVAVLVNGSYLEDESGEIVYQPRSEEQLQQFEALVRSAVGFDEERGDTIEVVNMQFFDIETEIETSASPLIMGFTQGEIMRIVELVVLGVVAILILLFVVRPLVVRFLTMPRSATTATAQDEFGFLPDPSGGQAMLAGPEIDPATGRPAAGAGGGLPAAAAAAHGGAQELENMININQIEGQVRASSLKKISEIVEQNPEEVVGLLRNWIYQES